MPILRIVFGVKNNKVYPDFLKIRLVIKKRRLELIEVLCLLAPFFAFLKSLVMSPQIATIKKSSQMLCETHLTHFVM